MTDTIYDTMQRHRAEPLVVPAEPVPDDAPSTHTVQAVSEDVDAGATIEFKGEPFRLAEGVALMPLMQFAQASKSGVNTDDMRTLAALLEVIGACIYRPLLLDEDGRPKRDPDTRKLLRDDTEWERFQQHATDVMAEDEDLNDFMQAAIEAISARKAQRRGSSSAGSQPTSEKSKAASSLRVPAGAEDLVSVAELGR
jgi:hypothetical protein